jgi:nitroimidazol reductase NimA-like FMN-containing flavoprotein (pyridoxamine 5'-phosphate oxidase superfamily)
MPVEAIPANDSPASERTTVRRRAQRGVYDRTTIAAILDEALICHVGFVVEGQPYVIPTIHARVDDRLMLHGAVSNRMLTAASGGIPLCVTATLVDGLVLARSALHHSMNYRSVVVLGAATEVVTRDAKLAAMRALVEHVVPGRWNDTRQPSDEELRTTRILTMPLGEASAKVHVGPPVDEEEDYARRTWAGELPLGLAIHAPVADPRLAEGIAVPEYLAHYRR